MNKVLVIFGSKSDQNVFDRICNRLKELDVDYDMVVSSAHKSPEDVQKWLENDYAVIIAGAGLAAHLPGVVAAKVICPVIGVPCSGNYQGLDALLSVAQMPPGVPVMGVGVDQAEHAAENASKMLKKKNAVHLIGDKEHKAVKKAMKTLEGFEIPYTHGDKPVDTAVNVSFVYFDEPVEEQENLVIYCPLLFEQDDKAEAALNFLKHSTHGLWVGINNGGNAAIAAVEVLNVDNSQEEKLLHHRASLREKIKKDNQSLHQGEKHDK